MTGLIVDLFAGGGGASLGIFWATGRHPDIAINHDPLALQMHAANHPTTKHVVENVWHVRPRAIIGKRKVDILWASPDCTHFSKAKGAAPRRDVNRAKRSRGLAWVILRWARDASPTTIFMENVEEWIDWCPLRKDGTPDPKRKGETRKRFIRELKKLGYSVDIVEKDRACDHGAPTIRQRLFMVARNDGIAIRRPLPTHGPKDGVRDLFSGPVKPWRPRRRSSIGPCGAPRSSPARRNWRRRPSAASRAAWCATSIDAADPFIVPITHRGDDRVHGINEPLRTVTTANRGELALATPFIARVDHSSAAHKNGIQPLTEPTRTDHDVRRRRLGRADPHQVPRRQRWAAHRPAGADRDGEQLRQAAGRLGADRFGNRRSGQHSQRRARWPGAARA
jgi:DNA (cytosine-5)-methyltransferase 1